MSSFISNVNSSHHKLIVLEIKVNKIDVSLTSTDYGNVTMVCHHNFLDLPQRLSRLYGAEIEAIVSSLRPGSTTDDRGGLATDIKIELMLCNISFLRARGDSFMRAVMKGVL